MLSAATLDTYTTAVGNVGSSYSNLLATGVRLDIPKNFAQPKQAAQVNMFGNDVFDVTAPGIRDGTANPTFFARDQHRTHLFDNNRTANAAPVPNFDDCNELFTDEVLQRRGELIWNITNEQELYTPGFIDRGTFNVPHVGFTAFRYLKPATTLNRVQ